MPTYRMFAPDGHEYEIDGPDGATDAQIREQIIRQNPHLAASPTPTTTVPDAPTAPVATLAAPSKPGPFQAIADAIYPAAPRPAEGLFDPALRVIGALAGAPQQVVEKVTGFGGGETLGPAMERVHGVVTPEEPGPKEGSIDYWLESKLGMQHQNRVPTREQFGEVGELGEHVVSDPLTYVGLPLIKHGKKIGESVTALRSIGKDVVSGAGEGLDTAGKVLSRAKAGVSRSNTIDEVPGAATSGLLRRGLDQPGASGGLRSADDPLTASDRAKMSRQNVTGATVKPYEESGIVIKTAKPSRLPKPVTTPTGRPGQIIDPYKRDYSDLTATGKRKGPTQGHLPLPEGTLRTSKELLSSDPQPSIVASLPPDMPVLPTVPIDEVAERLAAAHGHAVRDPRIIAVREALDVPGVNPSKKSAVLRGTLGALLGNAKGASASEGDEDDDTITRRVVYTLLGLGLGVMAWPLARRVLAGWRGRPMPKVSVPASPTRIAAGVSGKAVVAGGGKATPAVGDLQSAAEAASNTYGRGLTTKPIIPSHIEQALSTAPPPMGPATTVPILDLATGQKVAKFAEVLFTQNKYKYVPRDGALTDQLLDVIQMGDPAALNSALKTAGMSHAELLTVLGLERGSVAESARKLAAWSTTARNIQKALDSDPATRIILSPLQQLFSTLYRLPHNVMALWRGSLTAQLATGLRNLYVSAARTGLTQFDSMFDWAIRKAMGKPGSVSPIEGIEIWGRAWQNLGKEGKSKAFVKEMSAYQPDLMKTLHGELVEALHFSQGGDNVREAVGMLNWHNQIQEKFTRNVLFQTVLDREVSMLGLDLADLVKRGKMSDIPYAAIDRSVDEALRYTFALNPTPGTKAAALVDVARYWMAVPFFPFPRYLYNAVKFHMEYSPLGFLPSIRAGKRGEGLLVQAATTRDVSKALTGMLMFSTAYLMRSSSVAGDKWYQMKVGDKSYNITAYNPLAGFVLMAEFVRRVVNGERLMSGRELVDGLVGLPTAGIGFALVDNFMDSLTTYGWDDTWAWDKTTRTFKEGVGEWAAGFTTIFQQVQDLEDAFRSEPYMMDKRAGGLTGPMKAKLPGARMSGTPFGMLPPAVNPLHEAMPGMSLSLLNLRTE